MRKNPGAEAEIYAKIHIYRDNRELNEMETQRERTAKESFTWQHAAVADEVVVVAKE